jgi:hypothetical protein
MVRGAPGVSVAASGGAPRGPTCAARNSVRFPIFTPVVLWMLIFALVGVAFGASGAFWWAHFNTQVSELRSDTQDFETRSQSASADIEKQKNDATDQINAALVPLKDSLAATKTVQEAATYSPAVYQVVARRSGPALGRYRVRSSRARTRPACSPRTRRCGRPR